MKKSASTRLKRIVIHGMGYFYLLAGINHFLNPAFYLPLIPPFFSDQYLINIFAGIAEVLLGLGILYFPTRSMAAWGVVIMLFSFVPAHVYFIQIGSCVEGGLCVSEWIGWVRLVLIHPILIFWAFWIAKNPKIYG